MVSIEELKLGNETLEALKYLLLNVSELEGELKTIDMEELRQNYILIKENLAETKETLETIKPLEQKAQNVFNELTKTQEKLTELDALRKKTENLSALGLINDTLVDTDHTYSSSKINKLIDSTSLSTTTSLKSLSQNISTLQNSLSSGLSNADNKFVLKTDFEASKQGNGYTKLSNGLVLQWGKSNAIAQGSFVDVVLPIAYPNIALCAVSSAVGGGASTITTAMGTTFLNKATLRLFAWGNVALSSGAFWLTIGY